MSTHYFIRCPRKHQVAHLRPCIYAIYVLEIKSVPESDALISGSTPGCQETSLLWAPANGLNSSLMLTELCQVLFTVRKWLPYEKLIVVSARSNLVFIVHAPFEAAYLLLMPKKPLLIIFLGSNVSDKN